MQTCSFNKQDDDTVLRVAWDGNIALDECSQCCMRWFLTIDGEECSDPATIDAALSQNLDGVVNVLQRPASIVGICRAAETMGELSEGEHVVGLRVGACISTDDGLTVPPPSGASTGFYSVSRFIVEEIPDSRRDCTDE